MELLFLVIGIGAGLDYGLLKSWRQTSWTRTLTKATSMVSIIIWAILLGAPSIVVIALGFAAIGDIAVSRGELRWITASATAFFAFHALYLIEYSILANRPLMEVGPAIILATVCSVAVIFVCWESLSGHWLVGVLHTGIVLMQFSIGQMVGGAMIIIAYTTTLFLISALVLGLEMFLLEEDAPLRRLSSPLIWFTYLAGQILTVIGLTQFLQSGSI